MAYKLIWSPAARDDLHDIVVFIARVTILSGREYENETLREIILRPYRIVYRVNHERTVCEIARVWHSARGSLLL